MPFNSDAPDNLANKNALYQPGIAHQPALCQPYQSNPPYYSYQKSNKKRVYQINSAEFDNPLKGFYTMLEYEIEEVQYSDKGFDKVDTNFMKIQLLYKKYGSSFSFKSLLYKYLKNSCTSSIQLLLPTLTILTSSIPIIESKATILTIGSGLAFCR